MTMYYRMVDVKARKLLIVRTKVGDLLFWMIRRTRKVNIAVASSFATVEMITKATNNKSKNKTFVIFRFAMALN